MLSPVSPTILKSETSPDQAPETTRRAALADISGTGIDAISGGLTAKDVAGASMTSSRFRVDRFGARDRRRPAHAKSAAASAERLRLVADADAEYRPAMMLTAGSAHPDGRRCALRVFSEDRQALCCVGVGPHLKNVRVLCATTVQTSDDRTSGLSSVGEDAKAARDCLIRYGQQGRVKLVRDRARTAQ